MEEPITEILTEKQLKVFYGKSEVEETPLKEKIKKSLSCNGNCRNHISCIFE